MHTNLHYNVVTPLLLEVLRTCMSEKIFSSFRLVGGTALSLQRGHRKSVDIDLFTDAEYQSINFDAISQWLKLMYAYVDSVDIEPIGPGKSFFVGNDKNQCIKLDLYYTDDFIDEPLVIDKIRMATIRDIIAMKMDVILRGGRKKDFWDLHELFDEYTLNDMLSFHRKRYPFNYNQNLLIKKLTDFNEADNDFDPLCLYGKHWELVKLDILRFVETTSK